MNKKWYKLDNAALIYPSNINKNWTASYRIAAVLKSEVDPKLLQQAANDILPRFPTFKVEMRAGLFWYYFVENSAKFKIYEEYGYPCQRMDIGPHKYLFRIMYYKNRIIFEAFHSLTDGTGAFIFLNTLIHRYLSLNGVSIEGYEGCVNYLDKPSWEEAADSFNECADFEYFRPRKEEKSYQINLNKSEPGIFWLTHGTAKISDIKEISKKYNATIGIFLAALYIYSVYLVKEKIDKRKNKRMLKLSVTIDMRKTFKSKTLRNFSTYINFGIQGNKKYNFEEVLEVVRENYAKIDKTFMMGNINTNVNSQRKIAVRLIPLFLKNIALKISFRMYGESLNFSSFSNLGPIEAPKEFLNYVERYESAIGPLRTQSIALSALSYGENIIITFSSKTRQPVIEKQFFNFLSELGLELKIDSNRNN